MHTYLHILLKKNPLKNIVVFFVSFLFLISLATSDSFMGGNFAARQIYLYFVCSLILFALGGAFFFGKGHLKINVNLLDLSLVLFVLYSGARLIFTKYETIFNEKFILLVLLLIIYFIYKSLMTNKSENIFSSQTKYLLFTFVFGGIAQAVIGIAQIYKINIFYTQQKGMIAGTLGNSNYYAEYLSIIIPFSYGLYLFLVSCDKDNRYLRYLGGIAFTSGIFVLPSTFSRAGWLATAFGIGFLITVRYEILKKMKLRFGRKLRAVILFAVFVATVFFAYFAYSVKPDSATGRLLIWKITQSMIERNPVFGIGFDRLKVEYENYQADYFAKGLGTKYEQLLAGHVTHTYNEFLGLFAEIGIIGLVVFLFLIGYSIYLAMINRGKNNPLLISSQAGILSFAVVACFSFSMSIYSVFISFFFLLAIISANSGIKTLLIIESPKNADKLIAFISLFLSVLIGWNAMLLYDGQQKWKKAYYLTLQLNLKEAENGYKILYPRFKEDGMFLFMYGGVYSMSGKHTEAISLLESALNKYNDPNLWLTLGRSNESINNYSKAEFCYRKASNIIPHKYFPRYCLIKVLIKDKKIDEALLTGKKLMKMDVKIPSTAIDQMRKEIGELIARYSVLGK
ncbi:MAG TPA: O-antigen ligase family protein [Ignavibacteriales bacterium]|nr:O-antigen ligase family protein [Ignavibacteriales bacterium]